MCVSQGDTTMNLHLHVRKEYFDQIKIGTKDREYRKATNYWTKRLGSGNIKKIIVYNGYPSKTDTDKILTFPWNGYILTQIQHKEFGNNLVFVYAIKLQERFEDDN